MVKISQLRNIFTDIKFGVMKNTRFLPSIFLSIILISIISQIYIINDLPTLAKTLTSKNQQYQQQLSVVKQQKIATQQQLDSVVHNISGLESNARYKLGLIKDGEKFYYFPKEVENDTKNNL